jgi:hypothetical protein
MKQKKLKLSKLRKNPVFMAEISQIRAAIRNSESLEVIKNQLSKKWLKGG